MVHKQFSGLTLIVLGTLALLQMTGYYYFGLALWPAILLYVGLEIVWGSLFSPWHGPSLFGAALGLFVGGWGLAQILANVGIVTVVSAGDIVRLGWPVLVVALGLSLLFRRRSHHCHIDWH